MRTILVWNLGRAVIVHNVRDEIEAFDKAKMKYDDMDWQELPKIILEIK